jgi:hypothetical protein
MAYAAGREATLSLLEQSRHLLPGPQPPCTYGRWTLLLAAVEALAVVGERDEAAKLYPLVRDLTPPAVVLESASLLLPQRVAGIAATAGKQWQTAEAHYQTALRQAHELPHMIEQPEVRRWYARMLLDRDAPGDRGQARRFLTEAIAMYRALGMPRHVEMAEAMRDEAGR